LSTKRLPSSQALFTESVSSFAPGRSFGASWSGRGFGKGDLINDGNELCAVGDGCIVDDFET
jgi:hypothetical protein